MMFAKQEVGNIDHLRDDQKIFTTCIFNVITRSQAAFSKELSYRVCVPRNLHVNAQCERGLKVHSHLASTSAFACALASNLNIVSMVMLML